MHRRTLLLLALLFLLHSILFFSCSQKDILTNTERDWLNANDKITIAFFPYYPPYEFINENNTIEGVFIEYINLIERKINHKFKRQYYFHWPKLMEDVRNGKIDIIMQIQSTKNRDTYLNFYAELFESPHVIATRKDYFSGNKITDFTHKTITVPEDYAIFENLRRQYPNLTFIEDEDDLICLQKLNSGEYDAYIGPRAVVNYLIRTENLTKLHITGETDLIYKPGIGVDKNNKILNQIFQKAINNISQSENQNIFENWLYTETKPFYKKVDFLIPIVLLTLLGLLIILGINFYLGFIVKQKTKELRIAKDLAEKDDQLKTAFIHNVSYEIRTPMNNILGFSKFLNEPKLTNENKEKYTNVIINSGKKLVESVDNILQISQLQTKQVSLNVEEADLSEVLDDIYTFFEKQAREKSISLILNNNLKENQQFIRTDKAKLIKIINNLVENSINFTEKGAVLISCIVQNPTLIITIRDSGKGIYNRDRQAILEKDYKSENQISEKNGGLGLGLIIAKENAKLMKGKLSFSSIPSKGSTFRLELPYYPADINNTTTPSQTNIKNNKSKQHIVLIAEDGEVNFIFLKTILSKIKGYNFIIHRAKNGKEAITFCIKNEQINLVLMDIKMPEMNGYEATRIIKKMNPDLPIIAQTAYSTNEDIKNALNAGCDDFISKPIHPKTLRKLLKKHLQTA
ncbi:hybrid sensor histidine kinase/response regulator [Aquimarina sp. 2304DJ70-9]|uniref:hybrid sensor histidine kinase/response regulator n=1 Tax=Aquimarina penaris TaxID=3231044 RepID=UPI003462DAC9